MALNLMSNIFAAWNPESNNLSYQILENLLKTGFLHGVRTLHGVGGRKLFEICLTSPDPQKRKVNETLGFFWSLEKIPGRAV